jgi:hypothetical protein
MHTHTESAEPDKNRFVIDVGGGVGMVVVVTVRVLAVFVGIAAWVVVRGSVVCCCCVLVTRIRSAEAHISSNGHHV